MSIRSKVLSTVAALALAGGLGLPAVLATTAGAATAQLPAYPSTITLDLASPYCVTDAVIMNDPLNSTSPVTDTYGSVGSVSSHATPPVTYWLQYLPVNAGTWEGAAPAGAIPPGTQFSPATGELAAWNGTTLSGFTEGSPVTADSDITYIIRDHGTDTGGATGTTQYEIAVDNNGTTTTVSYEGNDFNNASGALTIQLNGGSTTSTALTLSAVDGSLDIPEEAGVGSTPVTFSLVNPGSGWELSGGSTAVLTGTGVSDPEIKAATPDGDVVLFTLSGISTTDDGVFYLNSDSDACVTAAASAPAASAAPVTLDIGDIVNKYGNGFDVLKRDYAESAVVAAWPATQDDPATHFSLSADGSGYSFQAVLPDGDLSGLCVSNPAGGDVTDPGGPDGIVLRYCNGSVFQRFALDMVSGKTYLISAVNGQYVNPDGKGAQFTTGDSPDADGGSAFTWVALASLPV